MVRANQLDIAVADQHQNIAAVPYLAILDDSNIWDNQIPEKYQGKKENTGVGVGVGGLK